MLWGQLMKSIKVYLNTKTKDEAKEVFIVMNIDHEDLSLKDIKKWRSCPCNQKHSQANRSFLPNIKQKTIKSSHIHKEIRTNEEKHRRGGRKIKGESEKK